MTIATKDETVTPDDCFEKAAKALDDNQCETAREWRQLGEAISVHVHRT